MRVEPQFNIFNLTNANDVVPAYLETGRFEPRPSLPTLSNAMDVGHPSNFVRRLWLYGGDREAMRRDVTGCRFSDDDVRATIKRVYEDHGYLLDPHSAIAVAAARRAGGDPAVPMIALACAHPAKFPAAVERATGVHPPLPPELSDLYDRPERRTVLPKDLAAIERFIVERARPVAAPAGAQGGV